MNGEIYKSQVKKRDKKIVARRSDGSLERILKRKEQKEAVKILELGVVLTTALSAAALSKKLQKKSQFKNI